MTKAPVNKTIECEINGQKVQVKEGTSIISAFKQLKQGIAHYCWHPGLSVAGVCRLCMVEIEGQAKLQIACNTKVAPGMKISNQSDKVKTAVKWGLEFHLINHPLDCPICDQAGECELQDQYMRFGKYSPNMAERKVKKRKVIDLGPKIVLDSERCILCSRCVRFTDEVSKTHELGIFHRGDRSEIGVFKDKPLDNDYSINTVDICPVGALTSKDFRFQQRVWYLKTKESVCIGCSTGCNIYADYNEEAIFRVRPRFNPKVNGHWMCDYGREVYSLPNPAGRLQEVHAPSAYSADREVQQDREVQGREVQGREVQQDREVQAIEPNKLLNSNKQGTANVFHIARPGADKTFGPAKNQAPALIELKENTATYLKKIKKLFVSPTSKDQSALIVTAQYTVEEYNDFLSFFTESVGTKESIYYWQNHPESFNDFDGLLLRGDKNPNTKGLLKVLQNKNALNNWKDLETKLERGEIKHLWVLGPENQKAYWDLEQKIKYFEKYATNIIWWTTHPLPVFDPQKTWAIPTLSFIEKQGTFINFSGLEQKLKPLPPLVPSALSLSESASVLKGQTLKVKEVDFFEKPMKTNYFTQQLTAAGEE